MPIIACPGCGTQINCPPGMTAGRCPRCGANVGQSFANLDSGNGEIASARPASREPGMSLTSKVIWGLVLVGMMGLFILKVGAAVVLAARGVVMDRPPVMNRIADGVELLCLLVGVLLFAKAVDAVSK